MSADDLTLTEAEDAALAGWWVSEGGDHEDIAIERLTDAVQRVLADRLAAAQAEADITERGLSDLLAQTQAQRDDARRRLAEVEALLRLGSKSRGYWQDDAGYGSVAGIREDHLRAALANPPAEPWLCSQCGERSSAMVKIGTSDGWCTACLDEAAENGLRDSLTELAETWESMGPKQQSTIDLLFEARALVDAYPPALAQHDAELIVAAVNALPALLAEVKDAREALARVDFMQPWGPFEMGGFEGCTDQNPDHCACANDEQPTCTVCGEEIEPGQQAWSRQWPCYDSLPLDHADQDWDVISWHDACPDAALTRGGETPC